jgi:DASH complex subunit DAM1
LPDKETFQGYNEGLKNLSALLTTFNKLFASWLYIMNMNALTMDWPQVCLKGGAFTSFELNKMRD